MAEDLRRGRAGEFASRDEAVQAALRDWKDHRDTLGYSIGELRALADVAEAMRRRGATPWRGLIIVDLRTGDIMQWLRLEGNVFELFDVGAVSNTRAPRGTNGFEAW